MVRINKNAIFKALAGALGFEVRKKHKHPRDIDQQAIDIFRRVEPFTMIGFERLFSLITAVRYVERNAIIGAFVECGVWKGGASAASAMTLESLGAGPRDIYLFDTFEGMSKPTDEDKTFADDGAMDEFQKTRTGEESSDWCCASQGEVEDNLRRLGLDPAAFHFVKGRVEDTSPNGRPSATSPCCASIRIGINPPGTS